MHAPEWIALGLIVGVALAWTTLRKAWRNPRTLLLIAVLSFGAAAVGFLIGLALGAIWSLSAIAFWVLALGVLVLELYPWRRRRARRSDRPPEGHS